MKSETLKNVFIISLPRSGSTLLQRRLMNHPDIASTPEPWILLPLFYATDAKGSYSEYWQSCASEAITDLIQKNNIQEDWNRGIQEFANNVYNSITSKKKHGASVFIDKTPRYSIICNKISKVFPKAKFIILWRNPADVLNSMNNSFTKNRLGAYAYKIDLEIGLKEMLLLEANEPGRCLSIKYEDFCTNPDFFCEKIYKFVGVNPAKDTKALKRLEGAMGDNTGQYKFSKITPQNQADSLYTKGFSQYIFSQSLLKNVPENLYSRFEYNKPKIKIRDYSLIADLTFVSVLIKDKILSLILRGKPLYKIW